MKKVLSTVLMMLVFIFLADISSAQFFYKTTNTVVLKESPNSKDIGSIGKDMLCIKVEPAEKKERIHISTLVGNLKGWVDKKDLTAVDKIELSKPVGCEIVKKTSSYFIHPGGTIAEICELKKGTYLNIIGGIIVKGTRYCVIQSQAKEYVKAEDLKVVPLKED